MENELKNKKTKQILPNFLKKWWPKLPRWRKRLTIGFGVFLALFYTQYFGVSYWYTHKHAKEPLQIGATFIPDYAREFELDPKETLGAMINDLGIRRFRLVSYWNNIEKVQGSYDFTELDWQFDMVEKTGGVISLSIGLRQPRWPECHIPEWGKALSSSDRKTKLNDFISSVVSRYKNRQGLVSYQLENEYFLDAFGECKDYGSDRQRLVDEFALVKKLDNKTPIIMSLANNYFGLPTGDPRPDQVGVSVYKRVWDSHVTHRYVEYVMTPRYYAWRAGLIEVFTGKTSMLHELQTEAWPPDTGIKNVDKSETDKTMSAKMLADRIQYGIDTGMRDIDLWGPEWWYWRKVKENDPELWNTAKTSIRKQQN